MLSADLLMQDAMNAQSPESISTIFTAGPAA